MGFPPRAVKEREAADVPPKSSRLCRAAWSIRFVPVLLVYATTCLAQTTAVVQAAKDPQAVSALTAYVSASGAPAASVQDFTTSGTVTYYSGGKKVQAPATAKALGAAGFRLDARLAEGTRSWVVGAVGGKLTNVDGTTSPIPWGNAASLISATWPLPSVLAALKDPNTQITYAGRVTFNGRPAYDIGLAEVLSPSADPTGDLGKATARNLFIDSSTYLALGLQNRAYARGSSRRTYPRQVLFSDYRSVNGVTLPFSTAEFITGQETWSFQVASVSFNTGLTSAAFVY